ncbi:hypothetical protein C1H76_5409 [Elsinoe australis]|uniref:Heterokaryon incompatibility domain-containing protein n=1 Tax=Elsinoe australis TaxID=40998 RepID=A0A4U7AZB2_9PEZI|nr:hypothetical protein C1H76_5409 [Elsinoe australis]
MTNGGVAWDRIVSQWSNPGDIFSLLLLVGGDVVQKAIARLVGLRIPIPWSGGTLIITPVAFSFGWVSYAFISLTAALGDHKLMPRPENDVLVVNCGDSGYVRTNNSWILGKIFQERERERSYKVRHVEKCDGNCKMEFINTEKLCTWIERQGEEGKAHFIPAVRFTALPGQSRSLHLYKVMPKGNFVAISHVWNEGLGNVAHNALPTCQLLQIQMWLDDAMGLPETPFWIDTLCIPRGTTRYVQDIRDQAMRQLAYVFQAATLTLVIDIQLLSVKPESSWTELCFRIACSSWLRRLWTL